MINHTADPQLNFASDNAVSVHPRVWKILKTIDAGAAMPYGDDDITSQLQDKLNTVFGTSCAAFPITNGTACNSLILSALVRGDDAILCHDFAHISNEECNAPELFTNGARLIGLGTPSGKLTVADLEQFLARGWQNRAHSPQPACVSITQLNEVGVRYSRDEIKALAFFCHNQGMKLHMDGARFANALAGGHDSPAQLSHECGVDALSLGFTKNGAFAAEVAIFFNIDDSVRFARLRKRGGQLWSKMRYISGQMLALLDDDLWLSIADHANSCARQLSQILEAKGARLLYPVDGNHVIVALDSSQAKTLREQGVVFYQWQKIDHAYRFVTSWNTSQESLDRLAQCHL